MLKKFDNSMQKAADFFAGLKMTIVSGVFLALSLGLLIAKNIVELNISPWLDPALFTVAISGYPLLYLAISRLVKQRWISSALLITVAMIASLCLSEVFAAGEVAFIMAIGAILEEKTAERTRKGLNKLVNMTPQTGRLLKEENGAIVEKTISADEIEAGVRLRVLAGEKIPVDGKIVMGTTSVDQSVLTGESLPVDRSQGDDVYCGTLNCWGVIEIEATRVGEDSSFKKMIRLLKEAENKKAPMQRIADRWATWLVPIAILVAALTVVITYFALDNEFYVALVRGVTILVVFCPCALVLATPTAVMAGIGQATKYGVLIKSGEAIEAIGKANCIAFDKTGTLTTGKLSVSDIKTFCEKSESELLALVGAVESRSEHPLGKAIAECARGRGITLADTENFLMMAGRGVSGEVNGKKYFCGNRKFLEENGIVFDLAQNSALDVLRKEGKAVVLVADESRAMGAIALTDTLRPTAKATVSKLKKMGYKIVLLTGDHRATAEYFAAQVGIDNIKAELLPEDKVKAIETLQKSGSNVCMIGDGINDAPALKSANASVSMSGIGSDIATEAAGAALLDDDIEKLPYLCVLSRATLKTIKLSISLSIIINIIAIALSSMGMLTPITGAIVHNVGSVLVVLIASLSYDRKYMKKAKKI